MLSKAVPEAVGLRLGHPDGTGSTGTTGVVVGRGTLAGGLEEDGTVTGALVARGAVVDPGAIVVEEVEPGEVVDVVGAVAGIGADGSTGTAVESDEGGDA